MKTQLAKLALAAALGLAITFTLNACEEKKKQDGADTKPPETASESQPSGGEKCSKEGSPITTEAVFLGTNEDSEGRASDIFRLPNGGQIAMDGYASDAAFILPNGKQVELNGSMPSDVKECDKVSITYKMMEISTGEDDGSCENINSLVSLKKIGSGVKLLESATDDKGRVKKFEYDKQNRIVKYHFSMPNVGSNDMTITYNSDDLITVVKDDKYVYKYVKNGNTITRDTEEFTINKEGYIFRQGYEYKDGNLIKAGDSDDFDYNEYDDKKSPFSNTNTPKWLLQELFYEFNPNKNNVLKNYYDYGDEGVTFFRYEYEYDGDGFPIKQMEDYAPTISFTYLCGTKN